jgi:hypothetical protein
MEELKIWVFKGKNSRKEKAVMKTEGSFPVPPIPDGYVQVLREIHTAISVATSAMLWGTAAWGAYNSLQNI